MRSRDIPPPIRPNRGSNQGVDPSRISERPSVRPEGQELPQRLDRDLTVYRNGVKWSFSNGRVQVNNLEVGRLLSSHPEDLGYWIGLADGLSEYRKIVSSIGEGSDQFANNMGRCDAMIEALLTKILGHLKKIYDQKLTGLSWSIEKRQLVLNGINIRSFLALYRLRRTDKARKFLKGLRGKLALLLENRHESSDFERVREIAEELYREIEEVLEGSPQNSQETARAARRLLPAGP